MVYVYWNFSYEPIISPFRESDRIDSDTLRLGCHDPYRADIDEYVPATVFRQFHSVDSERQSGVGPSIIWENITSPNFRS